jgi:hypothetical protein
MGIRIGIVQRPYLYFTQNTLTNYILTLHLLYKQAVKDRTLARGQAAPCR